MRQSGAVSQLARGIYLRDGVDVDHDLTGIALRSPRATLCLTTALAHHDLSDDIPGSINIALPREQWQPRTTAPVTWHRFDSDTFNIGRAAHRDVSIGIYDPMRSIIDAYRLRHCDPNHRTSGLTNLTPHTAADPSDQRGRYRQGTPRRSRPFPLRCFRRRLWNSPLRLELDACFVPAEFLQLSDERKPHHLVFCRYRITCHPSKVQAAEARALDRPL